MNVGDLVRVRIWNREYPSFDMEEGLGVIIHEIKTGYIAPGFDVLVQKTGRVVYYKKEWCKPVLTEEDS